MKNLTEKKISYVEKVYLYAFLFIPVTLITYFIAEKETFGLFAIFNLLFFNYALFNDIMENTRNIIKRQAIKIMGTLVLSLISTYIMIKTYQNVNEMIGINPSDLVFTTSFLFIINLITIPLYYLSILFLIFLILSTLVIPFLVMIIPALKEIKNNKEEKKKKFNRLLNISRAVAFVAVYIAGNAFSPERINSKIMKNHFILDIAINYDFNARHHCKNELLKDKPVLFLQKGYVLYPKDVNKTIKFEIVKCY